MNFRIHEEQDYYISELYLLPEPRYIHHDTWPDDAYVTPLSDTAWIMTSSSGMHLFQNIFSGGYLIQ